jgi:hypothetical protein
MNPSTRRDTTHTAVRPYSVKCVFSAGRTVAALHITQKPLREPHIREDGKFEQGPTWISKHG